MIQLMTKTINGNGIKHEALIKGTKELLTANNWLIAKQLASFESHVEIERLHFFGNFILFKDSIEHVFLKHIRSIGTFYLISIDVN